MSEPLEVVENQSASYRTVYVRDGKRFVGGLQMTKADGKLDLELADGHVTAEELAAAAEAIGILQKKASEWLAEKESAT